jgi:hypothetical protein
MPRLNGARQISRDGNTKIVQPRVKNLKPIETLIDWHELPSVTLDTAKDALLEFAQVGKVARLRGAG